MDPPSPASSVTSASSADEMFVVALHLEGPPLVPPLKYSPRWHEETLSYLHALNAREEARMRDLEFRGIHRVDAEGNVIGVQLPAKFLDPIGVSTSERLLPTPSSMKSPAWHLEAITCAQALHDRLDAEDRAKGTNAEEKRMWVEPALVLLGPLKAAGLTGVKVLWTFFERRVQPLKARVHPLFRYFGIGDLTRVSPEVLEPAEVRSRVRTVIKRR
ncbi:hypothetical protein BAE44_0011172 [Dichanthelium oligosanthes]|uniref:Uncharacterized protein n=1 Tax=Dichanthelium oligosanthes TaxID=888268 RepID=A0A1E5VRS3_9POAL|nr:hypothetical protein BAE44_0011172 [Dichanthelium oligosanthes]